MRKGEKIRNVRGVAGDGWTGTEIVEVKTRVENTAEGQPTKSEGIFG